MSEAKPGWEWVAGGIRHYTYASSLAGWIGGKLEPADRHAAFRATSARHDDATDSGRCGIQVRAEWAPLARIYLYEGVDPNEANPDYVISWPVEWTVIEAEHA
jgi:hypothetical protein